jgi:cell wall-associated NlpC family hydrolase
MQLTPSTWASAALDGNGDGTSSPDNVFDAAATTAEILCAPGKPLDTFAPLDRAVGALLVEGQQSTVALGTARRYARTADLDMGKVPDDPRAAAGDGSPQFDTSDTDLAPGDVLGVIDWAMTRVGTPYSQCLGVDARPQDPECPPGTNRFGSGFFDCSGFVSSTYRRIGITVPATTYAMEADPSFMATQVSDRIDLSVMEPGDVFLMDGHTGLYVGNGMIVHAIGGGLTHERVPGWVANGTFSVLRPLTLLGPTDLLPRP